MPTSNELGQHRTTTHRKNNDALPGHLESSVSDEMNAGRVPVG